MHEHSTTMTASALFDLSGRRALVTGSTAGIGLKVARTLGRAGARVVVNGRDAARTAETAARLAADGIDAAAAAFDVTDGAAVDAAFASEPLAAGVDILVNNAGIQRRAPLESFDPAVFEEVIATNLTSAFRVARAAAQGMIAGRRGVIVNVCSVQSTHARPSIAPYAASKGGLVMLTRGMATEWGKYGIRANGLAPGYFRTTLNSALVADAAFSAWVGGRTPLGRWGDVAELAGPALFLSSDASSFVTGHILTVDGGMTSCL